MCGISLPVTSLSASALKIEWRVFPMASRVLFIFLLWAVALCVAFTQVDARHLDLQAVTGHGHHAAAAANLATETSTQLNGAAYLPYIVPIGTLFQLKLNAGGLYLYSDGLEVKKTSDPSSVGILNTIWQSVEGFAPRSLAYLNAFAIRNTGTGVVLVYNGDFAAEDEPGDPLAAWLLYQSVSFFSEPVFKLNYLRFQNDGYIPGDWTFVNLGNDVTATAAAA